MKYISKKQDNQQRCLINKQIQAKRLKEFS